ncbi:MAG: hypothetical protein AAGF12_08490 [Myxococcota bacterium]
MKTRDHHEPSATTGRTSEPTAVPHGVSLVQEPRARRRVMEKRVAVLVVASVFASGCALFASKSEYADYRNVRIAEDERSKVVAMARYLGSHPNGTWAQEVQAERAAIEPRVWENSRGSREGLEFYLEAFPDGPHAEEARPRLAALQSVEGNREEEAEKARQVERDRREVLLERRRTWMTRASQFWTRTMIGIRNWDSPIAEVAGANPSFSRAFGNNPRPRCSREECIKFYRADYGIPVPGSTRIERSLEMFLRLRMVEGKVRRAELLLPNKGFSRWYEQENRTPVIDEDPTQRQEAISWALERIVPAIREVAPNAASVDVVPEPIDPPTVRAPNQADEGASLAPGDAPVEELEEEEEGEEAATPEAPEGDEGEGEGSGLDALMQQVVGEEEGGEETTPEPVEAAPEPEAMVLPIALQGFTAGSTRIVIFAAGDDDYGSAYDGLFIEYVEPEPEEPVRRRRGRRR